MMRLLDRMQRSLAGINLFSSMYIRAFRLTGSYLEESQGILSSFIRHLFGSANTLKERIFDRRSRVGTLSSVERGAMCVRHISHT